MKKTIYTLIILFTVLSMFGQDYPRLHEENGFQVITMTVEQAQKLDRKADLYEQLKLYVKDADQEKLRLFQVVDDQGKVIDAQAIELKAKDNVITSLKSEKDELLVKVDEYKKNNELYKEKSEKYEELASEFNSQLKKYKWKVAGIAGSAVALLAGFFMITK